MLDTLSKEERMLLLKFVSMFAWADDEIHEKERDFVARLVERFELEADELEQVEAWLTNAPPEQNMDASGVPPEHRRLFIYTARQVIMADGSLKQKELENLNVFKLLVEWAEYGDSLQS